MHKNALYGFSINNKQIPVFCHSTGQLTSLQGFGCGQQKFDGESGASRDDSNLVSTFVHVELDGRGVENNVQTVNRESRF